MKCAQSATPRSCRLENIIQKMPLYIGPDVDSAKGIPAEQETRPIPQNGDQPLQIDPIPHTPSGPPARVQCRVTRQVHGGHESLPAAGASRTGPFANIRRWSLRNMTRRRDFLSG